MNPSPSSPSLAIAAAASTGVARADEADASQFAMKFEGNRTRAEVMAEAATVSATRSIEPAGSRVAPCRSRTLDPKVVRARSRRGGAPGPDLRAVKSSFCKPLRHQSKNARQGLLLAMRPVSHGGALIQLRSVRVDVPAPTVIAVDA